MHAAQHLQVKLKQKTFVLFNMQMLTFLNFNSVSEPAAWVSLGNIYGSWYYIRYIHEDIGSLTT